nr:serine/threonine-protein kinase HT1-like [Ipomoea batatas]
MGNGLTRPTGYSQSESNESRLDITERINMSKLLIDESKLVHGYVISKSDNTTVHQGLYMGKPVAIKVIQKEKGTNVSPVRKEQFLREVRLLAAVKNDNIVKFIGFSMEPSMTLVTEIMPGGSLQRHLLSIRPVTLEHKDVLVLALEISRAMAYLHENGIIHRDLKPSNIFLSRSKKSMKLGDFGVCRLGLEGDFSADVGSIRWMAPEVHSRVQHGIETITTRYNHKVDVYSFAILVWELFTNKTPFEGMDRNMIARAVINRPNLDEEAIPHYIQHLLQSCWSNDPLRRPEFSEISVSLEEMLNGIEPGWDSIDPGILASRPDETKTLLGKAKKISTTVVLVVILSTQECAAVVLVAILSAQDCPAVGIRSAQDCAAVVLVVIRSAQDCAAVCLVFSLSVQDCAAVVLSAKSDM